jgi:AAA ATPase domain
MSGPVGGSPEWSEVGSRSSSPRIGSWPRGGFAPDNLRVVERLVGRRWELDVLIDLASSARSGRGRGLLLLGDAGIGKTTLAEALATEAEGCTVGWGRCPEIEALPYWPWRQALQALDAAAPLAASGAGGRPSMFADVAELLGRATATTPALLILEDVHLADPASLALLQFLAGMLPELRCALLLTGRDNSVDLPAAAAAALEALPPVVGRLTLRGLDRADTAVLVEQVLGRPDVNVADAVYERTDGNPFFVEELTRLYAVKNGPFLGPPAGVQQVVGRRLARLRQATNDCLSAAAVLGDDVDVTVLADVAHLPVPTVLDALDEAVDARLAVLDGARMRFAHALVREVLYDDLAAGRRGLLHGRAGVVLAARHAAAGTVAEHFRRALGHPHAAERAAEQSLLAARDAMRRGGYEQAVRYFRWADEGGADPAVRLGLGEALVLAGQLPEGRRVLRELARERLAAHDGETAARAVLAMGGGPGGFEVDLEDREQGTLLEQALPMLDAGATKAAALARIAVARAHRRADETARALAQDAIDMASRLGDARTEAAAISAWCDTAGGPEFVAERSARSRRMLALAEASGDRTLTLLARRLLIVALLEQGRFGAADEQIAAYAATAELLHTAFYAWLVPIWRGMRALMRADYACVGACLAQAAELARDAQSENAELMVFTLGVGLADATGTMADHRDLIDEVMAPYSEVPMAQGYLAYYLVKAGEPERATRLVEQRMADGIAAIPKDAEWLTSVALLGEAGRLLDHTAAVAACAAALRPYRDLWLYDGIGAACYGRVAEFLDRFSEFLGSRPVEELRVEAPAGSIGELRRIGAAWSVSWRGEPATIADAKGVRDLAALLSHPRTPIHVLDLMGAGPSAGGNTGPLLDQQARTAYRTRLRELTDELAEAEEFADLGRAERLRTEQQFLAHELAAALGLGGRTRVAGDPVERARKAVSMRIAAAIRAIDRVHAPLGRHLRASVRTGRHCVYEPEDDVTWQT